MILGTIIISVLGSLAFLACYAANRIDAACDGFHNFDSDRPE